MAIDLSPNETSRIERYVELLLEYNKKTNLTSFNGKKEIYEKGILPSLSGREFLPAGTVVDIGSGGGIPAIPLAILQKQTNWILLEPQKLKAFFLRECSAELGLRVKVVEEAAEEFLSKSKGSFEGITVRGVKLRPRILKLIRKRLKTGSFFLLWTGEEKGALYKEELAKNGLEIVMEKKLEWSEFMAVVPRGT